MSAQISADVRALFSDLGISVAGSDRDAVLVIDRFEHLRNPSDGHTRGTSGCLCNVADVLAEAA